MTRHSFVERNMKPLNIEHTTIRDLKIRQKRKRNAQCYVY